jgi:hypothetical protein
MLGIGNYSFTMVPSRRYKSVSGNKIKEPSFSGYDFKVGQIVYTYDPSRKNLSGFLLTNTTEKELAKRTGSWTGTLYIKAQTLDMGLWQISLPKTRIKQIANDIIWFHSDGTHSFKILKSNKRKTNEFRD